MKAPISLGLGCQEPSTPEVLYLVNSIPLVLNPTNCFVEGLEFRDYKVHADGNSLKPNLKPDPPNRRS